MAKDAADANAYLVLENLDEAVVAIDDACCVTFWNRAAEQWYGVPAEQALGRPIEQLVRVESSPSCWDNLYEQARRDGCWRGEVVHLGAGDRRIWVDWSITLRDKTDPTQGAVGIARDITARRQTEDTWRILAEQSRQGIAIIQDRRIVFANSAAAEVIGCTLDELFRLTPEQVLDLVHPDDRAMVGANHQARLDGKEAAPRYEYRGVRKDGSCFWMETHSTCIEHQGRPAVLSAIIDITARRTAEAALRASEERYRVLFETMNEGLGVVDAKGRVTFVNERLCEMLGVPADQLIGRRGEDLVSESCRENVLRHFASRPTGAAEPYEIVFKRKDGGDVHVLASPRPLFDKEGRFQGSMVIMMDITARVRAEQEVVRDRNQFLAGPVVTFRWKAAPGWPMDYVSPNVRQFGFKPEDFFDGRVAYLDIIHLDDRQRVVSDVETNVRTGLPSYTLQYRIVCPDGQTRWVYDYSVVIKNPRGEITHFDGYVMDITDRVRAEELVRAQRDLALELGVLSDLEPALCKCLSTASQLSGFDAGGILLWDGKGGLQLKVFQGISDEQARPLSYFDADSVLARAVVEGKPRYGFVSPGTAESLSSAGLRAGAILPLVQDHRPIGAMVVASRTTDDVPAETKGVLEAIAAQTGHAIARLAAEQDKAALAEQLRHAQKLEAIGRLAGGIAHDFNNILTAIMGYTEMLLTMTGPGDPLRIDLQEIDKASHRAADLTRQLLAFGRKQIIAPKVVNLNEIIQRGQRMLERLIGEDIELVATPAVGLGNVKVDPGQIEQVLINLAVNSRDAMPEGGVLAIETANVAFDDAYCRRCPEALPGDWAMLAVTDTGTGMDEDIKRHLFEPFFTTKEKDKGTGLGLATVYGIVKQSGGFLSVFTEVGVGSSFKVYLPRVEEEAVAIEKPAVAILPRGRETVLLVEDEAAVRTLTRKVLERHGYTVLEAAGAGEAFILFEKHPRRIHLLLTDVIMPSLNGRELYDRLCRIKPSLKVLYMSGYNEDVIALRGVLEPGTMFIQKPFTIEALVRKVRETLDIRRKVG